VQEPKPEDCYKDQPGKKKQQQHASPFIKNDPEGNINNPFKKTKGDIQKIVGFGRKPEQDRQRRDIR